MSICIVCIQLNCLAYYYCLYTVKLSWVFVLFAYSLIVLSITIVSIQLNCAEYFYRNLIILFTINHLFPQIERVSSIVATDTVKWLLVLFLKLIILFSTIHSFTLNKIVQCTVCPVGWSCRMHRLLLCRGIRPISARGVMVIVAGYEHGDMSSNPGPVWLHFI